MNLTSIYIILWVHYQNCETHEPSTNLYENQQATN